MYTWFKSIMTKKNYNVLNNNSCANKSFYKKNIFKIFYCNYRSKYQRKLKLERYTSSELVVPPML